MNGTAEDRENWQKCQRYLHYDVPPTPLGTFVVDQCVYAGPGIAPPTYAPRAALPAGPRAPALP